MLNECKPSQYMFYKHLYVYLYIVDIYVAQRIYVVSVLIYADVIHFNICDILYIEFKYSAV